MNKYISMIDRSWIPVFVISFIVALIITLVCAFKVRSKYKLVHKEHYAFDYINKEALKQKKIKDNYAGTHVNKSKKLNAKEK